MFCYYIGHNFVSWCNAVLATITKQWLLPVFICWDFHLILLAIPRRTHVQMIYMDEKNVLKIRLCLGSLRFQLPYKGFLWFSCRTSVSSLFWIVLLYKIWNMLLGKLSDESLTLFCRWSRWLVNCPYVFYLLLHSYMLF